MYKTNSAQIQMYHLSSTWEKVHPSFHSNLNFKFVRTIFAENMMWRKVETGRTMNEFIPYLTLLSSKYSQILSSFSIPLFQYSLHIPSLIYPQSNLFNLTTDCVFDNLIITHFVCRWFGYIISLHCRSPPAVWVNAPDTAAVLMTWKLDVKRLEILCCM